MIATNFMKNTQLPKAGERTQDHPLIPGDLVKVYNTTLGGELILEGEARVISQLDTDHYYAVKFKNGEKADRFCQPENKI